MDQENRLANIFVEQNILSAKTVERVMAIAGRMHKSVTDVLKDMELITCEELANVLAIQFKCKTAFDFARYSFKQELLDIIPGEVALENHIFPLKREEGRLALAMADPGNNKIVDNIAANNDLTIIPYVATRKEIDMAVCRHYFGMDSIEPSQKTILVVEDDKLLLTMLSNMLSRDYKVYTAMDGMQAYKDVVTKKPHVVLTDKEMPKLDGYGLMDALANMHETRNVPVILISGTSNADVEAEAFEKGFFDFISKPVKQLTLLTRVKRAFDFCERQHFLTMI
jgi:CheY-like chemotaxis protein